MRTYLNMCTNDSEGEVLIAENLQRFSRPVLQNFDVQGKTNVVRQQKLLESGKFVGTGLAFDSNSCCPDSLLQVMAAKGMVPHDLLTNINARKGACAACRSHLKTIRTRSCILEFVMQQVR